MFERTDQHGFPGKLIVLEGVEGSGKTTQLTLLQNWLESKGYAVLRTQRRTSKLVSKTIAKAKQRKTLTAITYSLIHAADFADRQENEVLPALRAGLIVLSDLYVYTSYARDIVRGNDREWVKKLYSFAILPDAAVYLRVPAQVCVERVTPDRIQQFYDAGMDTGLSEDPEQSFRLFHEKIIEQFDGWIAEQHNFHIIDGTQPIHVVQRELRQLVADHLHVDAAPGASLAGGF